MTKRKRTSNSGSSDEATKESKPLSVKHLRFVDEYLKTWNATEAYKSAYPKTSYTTARANGSRLLANANIRAEISRKLKEHAMDAEEVLARLTDHARGDHRPFVRISDDGFIYFDFSSPEALEHLHLIKKIKTKRARRVEGGGEDREEWEDEWVEVELHDPQRALELLGKANKLFVDRHEHSGQLNVDSKVVVYMPSNGRPDSNEGDHEAEPARD